MKKIFMIKIKKSHHNIKIRNIQHLDCKIQLLVPFLNFQVQNYQ